MSVKEKQSLRFRLKILSRRESSVWLTRRSKSRANFGWILCCKEDAVLFKDRSERRPLLIAIDDIAACKLD